MRSEIWRFCFYLQVRARPGATPGWGRRTPSPARSCWAVLASWDKMLGEGGELIMEKGVLSRLKGNALLPGVRSRGAVVKGIFIGADLGITSGLSGSSPPAEDSGEADLWSSSLDRDLSLGLGVRCGEYFWLPSSDFLHAVDKSSGWFLSCPFSFSAGKCCTESWPEIKCAASNSESFCWEPPNLSGVTTGDPSDEPSKDPLDRRSRLSFSSSSSSLKLFLSRSWSSPLMVERKEEDIEVKVGGIEVPPEPGPIEPKCGKSLISA